MHDYKTLLRRAGAVLFWLAVWQAAAMAIGQEVFLVSPVQALRCLLRLLPQGGEAAEIEYVWTEERTSAKYHFEAILIGGIVAASYLNAILHFWPGLHL